MDAKNELKKATDAIRASNDFDEKWYLKTYKDVGMLGMNAAEHYYKYGALMCRDPGPDFQTQFYLTTHPAAARQNANPLLHYLQAQKEQR